MSERKRYDDKYRASAVLMLEAAGYPDKDGALAQVSRHLGVPSSTLRGWFSSNHNPPPAQVRAEIKLDLKAAIQTELIGVFEQMGVTRPDASYGQLSTAAGILIDKLQLLEGKPTERSEQNVNVRLTEQERDRRINEILERGRSNRVGSVADGAGRLVQ